MGQEGDKGSMGRPPGAGGASCGEVTEAALGAEALIGRLQDIITEAIQPDADQAQAFQQMIGELDPAPEAEELRQALGMDEDGSRALPDGCR